MNTSFLLVTGNQHKLHEWQTAMPSHITLNSIDIDLTEIQSDDPLAIVADKAIRAYAEAGQPVIVEDVSAALERLNGLPGPFIKFFIKRLGKDALYQLAGGEGEKAIVSCNAAYYDGEQLITVHGDVPGTIVASRGDNGFGFDSTFIPDGHDKTYAEMTETEKLSVSHRGRAIQLLLEKLEK